MLINSYNLIYYRYQKSNYGKINKEFMAEKKTND